MNNMTGQNSMSARIQPTAGNCYIQHIEDVALRDRFCEARNSARQLLDPARSNYVQHTIESNANSPKKFWQGLQELLPGKERFF